MDSISCRRLTLGRDIGLGGVGVHHGVTFNFGSAKVCSSAIFETYFSYDKDIWIAAAEYYMHFYIIKRPVRDAYFFSPRFDSSPPDYGLP